MTTVLDITHPYWWRLCGGKRAPTTHIAFRIIDSLCLNAMAERAFARRPRQDSNLRSRFRRPVLYPLSYGGGYLGSVEAVPLLASSP